MLPTRVARFCCAELKERDIPELRFACRSFGVRKAESVKRALHRDSIEIRNNKGYSDNQLFHFDNTEKVKSTDACYTKNYFIVNPLAYWSDEYLWNYIHAEKLEINPLYSCGFSRVVCIGCPMAGKHRFFEFERYPKYKARYLKLCDDIVISLKERGVTPKYYTTGTEMFDWWLSDNPYKINDEQTLFDFEDE